MRVAWFPELHAPLVAGEGGAVPARACGSPSAPDPPPLAQADGPQLLPVFVLDPLDALELGVHDQRPPLGVAEDGGILGGCAVAGQPLVAPGSHISGVGEEAEGVQPWGDGDGHLPGRDRWPPGHRGAGAPWCQQAWREGAQAPRDGTHGHSPPAC